MEIVQSIILTAVFCLIPAGVLWLCRRFRAQVQKYVFR